MHFHALPRHHSYLIYAFEKPPSTSSTGAFQAPHITGIPFTNIILFSKNKKMLMRDEKEIIFHTVRLPEAGRAAVVLGLHDELFQCKTGGEKTFHDLEAERDHTALLPRIPHENGAEFAFLQDAIAFSCHLLHFRKERLAPQVGEVTREIFAVADDVRIGRVRTYEVDRGIGKKIQMPRIAFLNDDFSGIFKREIAFLMAPGKCRGIHIEADAVPMKELRLDKRRPAAGKLVEHPVAFFRIAKEKISGNVGGPVATIPGVMRRPAASLGEIPDSIHLEFEIFGLPFDLFHAAPRFLSSSSTPFSKS